LFVSALVFVLLRLSGDPASILLPFDATPEERVAFRKYFGLDAPILVQYLRFLGRSVRGDFGESLRYRQPAVSLFVERLPSTLALVGSALLVTTILGLTFGVAAAVARNSSLDHVVVTVALVMQSTPSFWLGIMLILLLSVQMRWLPTSGGGGVLHLIMPSLTVAASIVAEVVLLVRGSMIEALRSDYIRTAVAKGIPSRLVVLRHALRNAMIPAVTVLGIQFGSLMGGAVITETVFGWPGVGLLAVQSIFHRDFPVIQVSILNLAIMIALANLTVDLLYILIDPRIRLGD
jgi:peptide/nickel transport system permease protein